jgi:1,4-dihydroxy-2-naphthoate octaprenyltransferase
MSARQSGPFARTFILVNRVFGGLTALAGIYLIGISVIALLRGRAFADIWIVATFGVACLFVGVLYTRSPLTRAAPGDERGK